MTDIETKRAALLKELHDMRVPKGFIAELMESADAYGDARELKGHVEACGLTHAGDDWRQCGDGGYCEQALELGGKA